MYMVKKAEQVYLLVVEEWQHDNVPYARDGQDTARQSIHCRAKQTMKAKSVRKHA